MIRVKTKEGIVLIPAIVQNNGAKAIERYLKDGTVPKTPNDRGAHGANRSDHPPELRWSPPQSPRTNRCETP